LYEFIVTADENPTPVPDLVIDARKLACPLPLLKAKQGLHQLSSGQCLMIVATDKGSVRDFHSFAQLSEHHLLKFSETAGEYTYWLEKGQKR
jgi:tRNA 2-thiouridine synthesizing protein A